MLAVVFLGALPPVTRRGLDQGLHVGEVGVMLGVWEGEH